MLDGDAARSQYARCGPGVHRCPVEHRAGVIALLDGEPNSTTRPTPPGGIMSIRMRSIPAGLVLVTFATFALADESTIFAPIKPLSGFHLKLNLIADGLVQPLKAKIAPGEPGRFYVVNQSGELTAVEIATGAKTPFLSVASRL